MNIRKLFDLHLNFYPRNTMRASYGISIATILLLILVVDVDGKYCTERLVFYIYEKGILQ